MKKLRLCSYCSPVILIYTCKKSYDKNRVVKLDYISHIYHDNEAISSLDIASFFCALSLTEECFLFQQNPYFIYHRHNPPHLYAYIRCATYAKDGRDLCRRCDGINILFIDFLPLFRHLTLSMSDAACGSGGVFYTPENIMFSESISKCKNSRYVLNT